MDEDVYRDKDEDENDGLEDDDNGDGSSVTTAVMTRTMFTTTMYTCEDMGDDEDEKDKDDDNRHEDTSDDGNHHIDDDHEYDHDQKEGNDRDRDDDRLQPLFQGCFHSGFWSFGSLPLNPLLQCWGSGVARNMASCSPNIVEGRYGGVSKWFDFNLRLPAFRLYTQEYTV